MGNINSRFPLSSTLTSKLFSKVQRKRLNLILKLHMQKRMNCHVPSRFCSYNMFTYGEVKDPLRLYRGKDFVEVFCKHIEEETKRLYNMFPAKLMEPLMPEQ